MRTLNSCQHHINDQVKMPVWVARAKKNTPLLHLCFLLSWIYFILIFQFGMEGKVEGYVVGCLCVYLRVGNFEIMVLLLS